MTKSVKRRYKKSLTKKRFAKGKFKKYPRKNQHLDYEAIDGIILTAGENIEDSYWAETGHDLKTDLGNLVFEPDNTYMGSTLYAQALFKMVSWSKGEYGTNPGTNYIT